MANDDKEPKEQPKQEEESQETEIVLPEKDWQVALGSEPDSKDGDGDD
jgi:hypothetical protein